MTDTQADTEKIAKNAKKGVAISAKCGIIILKKKNKEVRMTNKDFFKTLESKKDRTFMCAEEIDFLMCVHALLHGMKKETLSCEGEANKKGGAA